MILEGAEEWKGKQMKVWSCREEEVAREHFTSPLRPNPVIVGLWLQITRITAGPSRYCPG